MTVSHALLLHENYNPEVMKKRKKQTKVKLIFNLNTHFIDNVFDNDLCCFLNLKGEMKSKTAEPKQYFKNAERESCFVFVHMMSFVKMMQ